MYGGGQQQQYISSQDYFTEHYSAMLVQEAEKLYNRLVNEISRKLPMNNLIFNPLENQ
jgi:hypothetical protein